jgi:hypothetical protein
MTGRDAVSVAVYGPIRPADDGKISVDDTDEIVMVMDDIVKSERCNGRSKSRLDMPLVRKRRSATDYTPCDLSFENVRMRSDRSRSTLERHGRNNRRRDQHLWIVEGYMTAFETDRVIGLEKAGVEIREGRAIPAGDGRPLKTRVLWFRGKTQHA